MIKLGVIYSIFKIRLGDSQGTAFTVEHADRQYFVTARHVLPGMSKRATVDIWHEERWKSMDVTMVGTGDGELDVTVLSATSQVSPLHALGMSVGGLIYSQPVYLLGFPLGLHSRGAEINRGLPIPFVKSGM